MSGRRVKVGAEPKVSTGPSALHVERTSGWMEFKATWHEKLRSVCSPGTTQGYISEHFVFRGMGCANHHLVSSFDRFLQENRLSNVDPFRTYTKAILSYVQAGRSVGLLDTSYDISPEIAKPEESPNFVKAEAFAQHNGFPTRLLDWSKSPYIAAFFAATNSALCRSGAISVWALNKREVKNLFNRDVEIIETQQYENRRLISQRGCFTRNETNIPDLDQLFLPEAKRLFDVPKAPVLVRFDIPITDAQGAVSDLGFMGIDFLSVYPDVEGMKEIARYKLISGGA